MEKRGRLKTLQNLKDATIRDEADRRAPWWGGVVTSTILELIIYLIWKGRSLKRTKQ